MSLQMPRSEILLSRRLQRDQINTFKTELMSEGEKNEQNPKRLALIPRVTAFVLPGNAARTERLRKVETPPIPVLCGGPCRKWGPRVPAKEHRNPREVTGLIWGTVSSCVKGKWESEQPCRRFQGGKEHGKGAAGRRQATPGGGAGDHLPGELVAVHMEKSGQNIGNPACSLWLARPCV